MNKTPPTDAPNMSVNDVAKYLGVTTKTVYSMIYDGRLPAYKLGARVLRLRRSDIDAALQLSGAN